MKGETIMEKNTAKPEENQEEKKEEGLYTIIDRYLEFCSQAHLNSGRVEWNDRYINCWFPY